MMAVPQLHRHARLVEYAQSGMAAPASPYDVDKALWVQPAVADSAVSPAEHALLADWLQRQPCPVIAVGSAEQLADDPWRASYDTVVDDLAAAASLQSHIEQAPLAATVLVQTLRVTANLPVAAALTVESLAYATLQGGSEFRRGLATHPPSEKRMDSPEPAVLIERPDAAPECLDIILNRPERRNALSVEMRDALVEALQLLLADNTIRLARLQGRGKCFSTGGDLDEFGTAPDPATAHAVRSLCLPATLLAQCAGRVECHVQGACIGAGVELPAFARRVIAAPGTFFQLPEIRFGLIPGAGGCVSLPRRIGRQRTAWLALSARRINAATAHSWGLVDEVSKG